MGRCPHGRLRRIPGYRGVGGEVMAGGGEGLFGDADQELGTGGACDAAVDGEDRVADVVRRLARKLPRSFGAILSDVPNGCSAVELGFAKVDSLKVSAIVAAPGEHCYQRICLGRARSA